MISCLAKAPPKKDGGHQERQSGGGPPAAGSGSGREFPNDQFAHRSFSDYPPSYEQEKKENRRLREMLKAVLDELFKHGVDVHTFVPPNNSGLPNNSVIQRNLEEGREPLDGIYGLGPDSDAFKPYTMKYRGREQVIHPSLTVEDYRKQYEIKRRELEPNPPHLL